MMRMIDNKLAVGWPGAVLFAFAYGVLAAISLAYTQTVDGIAVLWPSSGVFVAGLLLLKGRPRTLLMALIVPVSIGINLAYGASVGVACAFTLANLLEAGIASRIARAGDRHNRRFDRPRWVLRFSAGALIAAATSAAIAALTTGHLDDLNFVLSWFTTVLLGILVVAPAIITGARIIAGKEPVVASKGQIATVAALSAIAIGVTFFQRDYPLLFLPLAATVLATYVLGVVGALGIVLAIAIAGTVALTIGTSPITFVDDPTAEIYFLQFYLLMMFVSALPLATLLARSRAQMKEIAFRKAQHDAAQSFAHVGHWRYCLRSNTSDWSEGMFHIYGLDPEKDRAMNLEHGSIVPEDNAMVRDVLAKAVAKHQQFILKARIQRSDGAIRHVESLGDVEYEEGRPVAIFGVLKDVTDYVQAAEELERQRALAEKLAHDAVLLSETDQLTGIANRRKLLARLGEEIARADRAGRGLAVMMIDVDHFKSVNDMYGHAVGDQVLCEIAALGQRQLRKGDLFGRLGGEEFLVILPDTSRHVAALVGERLRASCQALDWANLEGPASVSISIGVALHQHGADETFLLQAADAALYQSKTTGRNRLTIAA